MGGVCTLQAAPLRSEEAEDPRSWPGTLLRLFQGGTASLVLEARMHGVACSYFRGGEGHVPEEAAGGGGGLLFLWG